MPASFETLVRSSRPAFSSMMTNTKSTDRATVDDDLHGSDKFRSHQQIKPGQRDHHHDERQRAVNRVALQDEAHRADNTHRGEDEENDERHVHQWLLQRMAEAVMTTLASDTGRSSFQPKAIN